MKEVLISNCEKEFIKEGVLQNRRIDGRHCHEFRNVEIVYGSEYGSCQINVGKTRAVAQVSAEVITPQPTRPSEGLLFINVELNPMAAPQFEPGKPSETGIEITRIVERCLKDSKCVDLEALCIVTGNQVWQIRVDVHVINNDGNMADCACIAAIVSLLHFKHPDITVSGEDVIIHPIEKREAVSLSIHHIPICITFAFFDQGSRLLVDPTEREECAMEGKMVFGMNSHREICTLHLGGTMLLLKDQIKRCAEIAAIRADEITTVIRRTLAKDASLRKTGKVGGFPEVFKTDKITVNKLPVAHIITAQPEEIKDETADYMDSPKARVTVKGPGTAQLQVGDGGPSTWDNIDNDTNDDDVSVSVDKSLKIESDDVKMEGESDEEEVVMLESPEFNTSTKIEELNEPPTVDLTQALKKTKKKKNKR